MIEATLNPTAISNECPASQDDDNAGNQTGLNQLATLATNCNGNLNQRDGAATASTSHHTTSHQRHHNYIYHKTNKNSLFFYYILYDIVRKAEASTTITDHEA